MSDEATTHRGRKKQYELRVNRILWVGAGLAGLVAMATGDAFDSAAPPWLKATEITLIIVCAAFLAQARVKFEWEVTKIERSLEDAKVAAADADPPLSTKMMAWPGDAEDCWSLSLSTLIVAGLVMALCFWWPVVFGKGAAPRPMTGDPRSRTEGH